MDIEEKERAKLIERFSKWFDFEEEVSVFSTHYNRKLRVDVIGKPKTEFTNLLFAFEVKNKTDWKMANFAKACKQASDYVYCVVENSKFTGEVINSAYIFMPEDGAKIRDDAKKPILGIRALAAKHRVGTLSTRHENRKYWRATLSLFNDIWYSDQGYSVHARGNLQGKRPLGGTSVSWYQVESAIKQNYSKR